MQKLLLIILALFISLHVNAEINLPPFDSFGIEGFEKKTYRNDRTKKLTFTNKKGVQINKNLRGQYWDLRLKLKDKSENPAIRKQFLLKLKELNADVLFNDAKRVIAKIELKEKINSPKSYVYVVFGDVRNKYVSLELYKEQVILSDKPLIITFDNKAKSPEIIVYKANFDGKHFYTLKGTVLEGRGIKLNAATADFKGINIKHKFDFEFDSKYYKDYQVFKFAPYFSTQQLKFEPLDGKKTSVRLELVKTPYTLPELGKLSKKTGLLKMKNSLSSLPELSSMGYISSDIGIEGDYLPDGDATFWLKNGYYSLIKDKLRSNLVPVLQNHMTVIEWPLFYEEINEVKSKTENKVKLAIYDAKKIEQDKGQVDISLAHLPKGLELKKEDFSIFEAGSVKGKPLSIERLPEPMNIVILLDSSGSMKNSMKVAIDSVRNFINKLPEDAQITLVDFDTTVKPIKAKNREELINKLNTIKPNGATALYDSLIDGIDLLKNKSRASIILFTDGKDANYNDTKRGSKATFEQAIKKVQESKLPIYPVAFGNNADITTLNTIASITKTNYYQGDNLVKLDKIFSEINQSLSTAFRIKYQRGKTTAVSEQPVINYMVDVSGSMDLRYTMATSCEGCGYRYEQLKDMLAQSITTLPDDNIIQLSSFSSKVNTLQILTKDKAKLLAGIGALKIGGGTDIIKAVKRGLQLSQVIPSHRRYFVFITDAAGKAFEFNEEENKILQASLLAFKRAGIKSFWIGMVESDKAKKAVDLLAKTSGGIAFVSADVNQVKKKVLEFTASFNEITDEKNDVGTVEVRLRKNNKLTGEILTAIGHKKVDYELLKALETTPVAPEIDYKITRFKADEKSYNFENSTKIYGDDTPLKDVRVLKIIPLLDKDNKPIAKQNSAMTLEVSSAILFNRLKGINAGHKYQYMVLDMKLSNILKEQEIAILDDGSKHPSSWLDKKTEDYNYRKAIPTYKIPNIKNHLFIRINDSHEVPFNLITWALEKPLVNIDQKEVWVENDKEVSGVLAFKISSEPIKSLSLHFYDSDYGHIDLPIIGKMKIPASQIEKLPKKQTKELTDAFSLSILSRKFESELSGITASEDSLFEVINCKIDSKVNALLSLNPEERFRLIIKSKNGDWILPPHAITARVPFGLFNDISLAPGSKNNLAIVFQIPKALKNEEHALLIELKGEDKVVPISLPNEVSQKNTNSEVLTTIKGDKIAISINRINAIKKMDGRSFNGLLVDISLNDEKDTLSTRLRNFLTLSNKKKQNLKGRSTKVLENKAKAKGLGNFSSRSGISENTKKFVGINKETTSRILGCEKVFFDGTETRCIILFDLNTIDKTKDLHLISSVFTELNYQFQLEDIEPLSEESLFLLSKKLELPTYNEGEQLVKLLTKVRQRKISEGSYDLNPGKRKMSLDSKKDVEQFIKPMPVSFIGGQTMAKIDSYSKMLSALTHIEWVPAATSNLMYSPEAMFTQGWGTEYEMLSAVKRVIQSRNFEFSMGRLTLKPAGKKKLQSLANGKKVTLEHLPFIEWQDDDGLNSLVFPFMESKEVLADVVDINQERKIRSLGINKARIELVLHYEIKQDGKIGQIGTMGSALSGSVSKKINKKKILSKSFPLNHYANTPVDIWFGEGKNGKGEDILNIFVYEEEGTEIYKASLGGKIIPKKLSVKLDSGTERLDEYQYSFKKKQEITDLFFTFAFASPDLSEDSLKAMEESRLSQFKNIKNIAEFSKLQWTNRSKIYNFIGLQTRYEKHLEDVLNVKAKRNKTPRTIVAMIEKTPDNKLISSLDLRSVFNDVDGDEDRVKSFNIMSALFNAEAEARVIPKGKGTLDIWREKSDQHFIMLPDKEKEKALKWMIENGISVSIQKRYQASDNIWVFPTDTSDNKAWFEINPKTYRTISVLENGQYGSMTESAIQEQLNAIAFYGVGILGGISISELSVMGHSLFYADYCPLLKAAERFANNVACGISAGTTILEPSVMSVTSSALGCVGESTGSKVMAMEEAFAKMITEGKKGLAGSLGGIANGFGDAVSIYFAIVKGKAQCK